MIKCMAQHEKPHAVWNKNGPQKHYLSVQSTYILSREKLRYKMSTCGTSRHFFPLRGAYLVQNEFVQVGHVSLIGNRAFIIISKVFL